MNRKHIILLISWLILGLQLVAGDLLSQTVNAVVSASSDKIAQAKAAQKKINRINKSTNKLVAEYDLLNKRLEGVRAYNAQLRLQIKDQKNNISQLNSSLVEATTMEGDMAPLVEQMIEGLSQFISMDLPFDVDERTEAVQRLRENQSDSLLTAAERFRQILETYRIEGDYGKNIDTKSKILNIDGADRHVNILRVGRIALLYQSDDQQLNGAWNKQNKTWDKVSKGDYRAAFSHLYKMANKQASINMMMLPIFAPEEAK